MNLEKNLDLLSLKNLNFKTRLAFRKFSPFFIFSILITALGGGCGKSPITSIDHLEVPLRQVGGEFSRATDLYGTSVVREGEVYAEAPIVPWTGPWYPIYDDYLFRDGSSPLAKYDAYAAKHGVNSHAADFERKHFFYTDAAAWAGRCDAWALASVMAPEPAVNGSVNLDGVNFTTADLKALLILSYENVDGLIQFGQRFNGDYKSVPEDIFPDEFQRILEVALIQKHQALVMDKDPGVEVWNTPIYKADITIHKDPTDSHVMHVHAAIMGVDPLEQGDNYNYVGTRDKVFEYTYDLYGHPQSDGSLKVVYGIWTGESREWHPDFVWSLPTEVHRSSENLELQTKIVDEILARARQ